jgi:hypothetical protein
MQVELALSVTGSAAVFEIAVTVCAPVLGFLKVHVLVRRTPDTVVLTDT